MLSNFENYLKLHVNSNKTIKDYISRLQHFFDRYKEFNQESINDYLTWLINQNKKSLFLYEALNRINNKRQFKEIENEDVIDPFELILMLNDVLNDLNNKKGNNNAIK